MTVTLRTGSSLDEPLQVLARQEPRVLRPLEEGADVVAERLHVETLQPPSHQGPPFLRVVLAIQFLPLYSYPFDETVEKSRSSENRGREKNLSQRERNYS